MALGRFWLGRQSVSAIAVVIPALIGPAPGHAATISFGSGPTTGLVTVQQFDPSLGTLNSVTGFIDATVVNQITTSTPSATAVPWSGGNFFGLYFGPTYFDISTTGSGTVDVGGGIALVTTAGSGVDVRTDAPVLSYFTGTGSLVAGPTIDPPFGLTFGEPVILAEPVSRLYSFTVTYDFTPSPSAIPETSTWAAMTIGFAVPGTALRRRRRHEGAPSRG